MMTLPEDLLVDPLQGARHREHPEDEEDQAGGGRGIKRGRRGGEQVIHDGYLRAPGRVEGNPWTSRALRPCPPSRHENAYWRARADAVAMTTDSPLEGRPYSPGHHHQHRHLSPVPDPGDDQMHITDS